MSIEFSPAFDRVTGFQPVSAAVGNHGVKTCATSSPRRLAANRRNAQRSTGPRTAAGKQRASRNAIKHGLCSPYACLKAECAATYATFVREIEEELQPRTAMQRSLIPHIANLMWRIDRLPRAQADMFELELKKCARDEQLSASQIIARRFSDEPTKNGFLLIGRYERGLQNQLLRLMSRYEWLKKNRPTTPLDEDEIRAARRKHDAEIDAYVANCSRQINQATAREEAERAKRTQSKPSENREISPIPANSPAACATPPAKRTQRDDADSDNPCQSASVPLASSAPKIHGDSDAIRDDIQQPQHEQESEPWPT